MKYPNKKILLFFFSIYYFLILSTRSQSTVDEAVKKIVAEGGKAFGLQSHAGNQADREQLINFVKEKVGHLDILVLNAGVNPHTGRFLTIEERQMDKIFEVNFKGSFYTI